MKYRLILVIICLISFKTYSESGTKIYLTTIGPGDELYLRWGHFAIIVDYEDKKDILFDYGNFSFQDDAFVQEFIQGIMTYMKARKSADYEIRKYKEFNRSITMQELNLTDEEIEKYIIKLKTDIRLENMYYDYDHYYDNCVSQMIEYLDSVTDGAFFRGTSRLSGRSFRGLSRDYVSSSYLYNLLIMFVLGSKVDYTVTEREAMFLPDYAMQRAEEVYISDGNGGEKPLVKNTIEVYKSIDRDPVIIDAKPKYFINTIVGLLLALVVYLIRRSKRGHRVLNITSGLILGLTGSILFFMAFFTGHYYIHNNWNLILISPLSFMLFIAGVLKIHRKSRNHGDRVEQLYIDGTLLLTVGMIVLKSVGLISQMNGEIILLALPLLISQSSLFFLINQSGSGVKLSPNPESDSDADSNSSLEESTTTEASSI